MTLARPDVVLRSKLAPPVLPEGLLVRDRMNTLLSTPSRVTLVCALPGFGKTVAVRHWFDTLDRPAAWLSLDMLDVDPMMFWAHFLLAVESVGPDVDAEPALLLAERGPDDALFLAALAAQLEQLPSHCTVVLDGMDDRLATSALEGLALLVERCGDRLQLVITTRSVPPLPVAHWHTRGWLAEIGAHDLELTDEEAIDVAGVQHVDPAEDIVDLNDRVGRWPIGFHMALLAEPDEVALRLGAIETGAIDRPGRSYTRLADYLAANVVAAMSDEERDAALALSVLEWFDHEMCERLVGPGSGAAVRSLLRRGVFLTVTDRRTGAMRFHSLFRELMENELSVQDPARRTELHRRAATLWRERGDVMSAYHHLTAIGRRADTHELLVRPVLRLVDEGNLPELRRLAHQLPARDVVVDAGLSLDFAVVSKFAGNTQSAAAWMDRAEAIMSADPVPFCDGGAELDLRLNDVRAAVALLDADLDTVLHCIERRSSLRKSPLIPGEFGQRFPITAARAFLAARRDDESRVWIERAERLDGPEILRMATVPTLRSWYEWLFGDLDRATELSDRAIGWLTEHAIGAHHFAFDAWITAGWCRLARGEIDVAAQLVARAREDADILGCAWNHLQAGFMAGRLAVMTGNPGEALGIIDDLRSRLDFTSCEPYSERILGLEIEAVIGQGRFSAAARLTETLHPGPRAQLLNARCLTGTGAATPAVIADVLAGHESWMMPERLHAELLVITTDTTTRPTDLVPLLQRGATSGWVSPFVDAGVHAERMMRSLPLHDIHPRLGRTLGQLAPNVATASELAGGVRLTQRELTLLELLPTHLSYAEMGARLFLSINTVKTNLKTLYRKLDARTRSEAVEAGRQAGLL